MNTNKRPLVPAACPHIRALHGTRSRSTCLKTIQTSNNQFIKVCDCHYDLVAPFTWHISHYGYAATNLSRRKGMPRTVYMHRFIAGTMGKYQTDHKDNDKLNNQCSNLRVCTQKQNRHNTMLTPSNRSGYKGVFWEKRRQHWVAVIAYDKSPHYLGSFDNPVDAARAYNAAALDRYGEFAYLNKVEP